MFENGIRPMAEHLMALPPKERAAVQKGLGEFAQAASKAATEDVKGGKIEWPQYAGEMILYVIAQIVAEADDKQLANLGSAAASASQLADLHSRAMTAGGQKFLDLINSLTGKDQQPAQNAALQRYQAFTSQGQQLTSMDSSLGSQISSTTGPTQSTTSSLYQMTSQLISALTQALRGIMNAGG